MSSIAFAAATLVCILGGARCASDTSRLTAEQEARFKLEGGILRRADNIVFHYTNERGAERPERREDRLASIVVTRRTVLIHKNQKVGMEITTDSRRVYDVHRRETRVSIRAGGGRSHEVWSFEPPDDADGWTRDIRAVIRGGVETGPSARRGRSRTSPG